MSKHTQLWRAFGNWPVPQFDSLNADEKRDFYRKIADLDKKEMVAMAEDINAKAWLRCVPSPVATWVLLD